MTLDLGKREEPVAQTGSPLANMDYLGLQKDIEELKKKVEPLQQEVITTPMWPVVARIMNLNVEGERKTEEIKQEIEECKRLLNEMAFDWISQIISKPEPSRVFKVVNNTNIFERELAKQTGERITLNGGYEIEITPALLKFLTRFKFSIGTPPITKKGMETIEQILFGGQLGDIYGFRNLLGTKIDVFDRFMKTVDEMVTQSTHYTTEKEKKEFERKARDFSNMEGTRGFTKTAVSGSYDTAYRLIKEHLFSQHRNGHAPLIERKMDDLSDRSELESLMKEMKEKRTGIFIVRVKDVPHNTFTTDTLKDEWRGLLGRLVLVEDSPVSQKTTTTLVYSFNPEITANLAKFHVKDSGTLANTQLNLRSLMEGFSGEEMSELKGKVEETIAYMKSQGADSPSVNYDRKQEWLVSTQKDFVSLQKFKKFLKFIEKIKSGTTEGVDAMKTEMIAEVEKLEREYFFKDLPESEYKCIYVPQGGGRRELSLIGSYHLAKHRKRVDEFKARFLDPSSPNTLTKLQALKHARGFSPDTSTAEAASLERALSGLESPNQSIRDFESAETEPLNKIRESIRQAVYKGARDAESIVKNVLMESLDSILGKNVPGILKKKISELLANSNLSSASKIFERAPFRTFADKFRSFEGTIRRWVDEYLASPIVEGATNVRRNFEKGSLELAERMLNDIRKKGAFEPHLALAEMGWSFGDVLIEDDFPAQSYISIEMEKDGELKLESLEKHLEKMKEDLHDFPEIFELYCSSVLLIFNDPHNPTSKVAKSKTKLKLLDLASKYGLSILADEAYHKMIEKDLKEEQGDASLASFYNQNLARFPRPVTIYSSLPSTKWGMGAGRRSGNILTNDLDSHEIMTPSGESEKMTFEEFARKNIDGVNIMSLWFDLETLKTGIAGRKVCKTLESTLLNPIKNPIEVMDDLLGEMVSEIDSEEFQGAIYFKLIKARNDLDRLLIREAGPILIRQYISDWISELKDIRLDKQTRKDTENRVIAGKKAIKRLSKKIPGLDQRYIKPEGPFYLCVQFDETQRDSGLRPFVEAFAKARGIDGVHADKGEVRFSFGGMVDGTPESYEMLSVGFEQALELGLRYWEEFKEIRKRLNDQKDPDPTYRALKELFSSEGNLAKNTVEDREKMVCLFELLQQSSDKDVLKKIAKEWAKSSASAKGSDKNSSEKLNGESELGDVLNSVCEKDITIILDLLKKYKHLKAHFEEQEDEEAELHAMQKLFEGETRIPENPSALKILISIFHKYKEKGKSPLVFTVSSDASKYVSQIQPDSKSSIITIKGVACKDMQSFIESEPFQTLFNFYLLKVKDKIPKLKNLTEGEALGKYEALRFAEKVQERKFEPEERELFAQIAIEIAKIWYSDDTTKILAENFKNADAELQKKALVGTEAIVNRYIKEFLQVFITEQQEKALEIKPTFQVGYQSINGVKAGENLQPWMRQLIESSEFAGQTVPTDPGPEITTGSTARVAGFDYGIYRRDGDGKNAPDKKYFRERLGKFMEKMAPKDYVCKMVQIGPVKTLLVMNRAYSHYMADEMRLFPQFELTAKDMKSLEPDAISFMGIPRKVMGDDYKVGYFMDEDLTGKQVPVSWVDAEQFTDYVGYLKKPLLTVANEKVKESGGIPIHGSAFTIVFKSGLRKTLVIGGDSGAGKSETIIAMIEQSIKEEGEAADVEGIDMLAGDMLSMYEGGAGEVYMLGTEEGDFMRMSDISENWKSSFRDKLKKGNTTNKSHPTNPRKTIGGLCDPEGFLRPVRINNFYYIDNYTIPKGKSFQEVKSPENLLMDIYARGYRREKGTSGDQPNFVASLSNTEGVNSETILLEYGEDLDRVLGWQTTLAESGKVKSATLSFRDKPNMVFRAKAMVDDMFKGKNFTDEDGEKWEISNVIYVHKNSQYQVEMISSEGQKRVQALDRSVFDKIYNPITSTYGGNPFVHPSGMGEILKRFSGVMDKAGIITGILYSQLAVEGEQFSGPAQASRDAIGFMKKDPRVNDRFQRNQRKVHEALLKKYGEWVVGPENLPEKLKAFNLYLKERHESDTIKFVDADKNHIDIRTPKYKFKAKAAKKKFNASLTTPQVRKALNAVITSNNYKRINLAQFNPDMGLYDRIQAWDNKEELVYQIMMINGFVRLGDDHSVFRRAATEVKKAMVIADKIIEGRKAA